MASLNSGSNGNCYYVGNDDEAVLIDAGISCREIETRMSRMGLDCAKVRALFITHEHSDHIRGVSVFSRKHGIPVYITPRTARSGRVQILPELSRTFSIHSPVHIGSLAINAFPKFHDAADPCSFTVSGNGVRIGIMTDIGRVCNDVIHHFRHCHGVFLETNYDAHMLETGRYPRMLKNRIRGGHGHLSNAEALELFIRHRPAFMSHVLLSHLSQDNNSPELVQELFQQHAGHTHVTVASRHCESEVYRVIAPGAAPKKITARKAQPVSRQISLF